MTALNAAALSELYHRELLDDVLPFWLEHSPDRDCGGYFTCLDRCGGIFDTDKFLWLQGREVWTLSKMYRRVRPDPAWLEAARGGAEFLRDHGRDEHGRFYFALERDGRPYARPCIFSDCFCAMGLAEYAAASGQEWARELALETYAGVRRWLQTRQEPYPRYVPGARPMESMVYDMIHVNLVVELSESIDEPRLREAGLASMDRLLGLFIDRREGLVFEHVAPDGSHPDTFRGRLVNPGHALECLWFLMDAGLRWGRADAVSTAVEAMPEMLEFGWDDAEGGLFYFLDARGKPPEQLEWDQKLWWVHGEALVATLLAYRCTGQERFAAWFRRIHEYTWGRFPDGEFGEWFGYLNRQGRPALELKGGKWKGCFHVPRSLWKCWRLLEELREAPPASAPASGPAT